MFPTANQKYLQEGKCSTGSEDCSFVAEHSYKPSNFSSTAYSTYLYEYSKNIIHPQIDLKIHYQ
jgi:hypothetical protein